jgi:hypothetical protein
MVTAGMALRDRSDRIAEERLEFGRLIVFRRAGDVGVNRRSDRNRRMAERRRHGLQGCASFLKAISRIRGAGCATGSPGVMCVDQIVDNGLEDDDSDERFERRVHASDLPRPTFHRQSKCFRA